MAKAERMSPISKFDNAPMNDQETKTQPDALDILIERYPIVFKNFSENDMFISNVPAGWFNIVDEMCQKLSSLIEESYAKYPPSEDSPGFSVLQIKEKFGGLRFYWLMNSKDDDVYEKIREIIDECETKAEVTCQVTGNPGKLCKNGRWLYTLSEETMKAYSATPVTK